MSYLYGDSTQSTLELNYIEFLRDAMDLLVAIVLADHNSRTTREKAGVARTNAEKELQSLHNFSDKMTQFLEDVHAGAHAGGPTARCAQTIRTSSAEAIRATASQIKNQLASEVSQFENQSKIDRGGCLQAIEAFILRHDLPGSVHRLEFRLEGDSYRARLSGSSKEALSWVVDLAIPNGNMFTSPLRVDRLVDHLEVKVPELSGWVRKSMKLQSRKLTSKYITGLVHTTGESTLKLRVSPTDDSGFDLNVIGTRARLLFQGKEAEGNVEPFEPDAEDSAKLVELMRAALNESAAIRQQRTKLIDARLDGKSINEHDNPAILAQRLISRMAPIVTQIAKHSLSPRELVLKRVLADDRREEIFVAKTDLIAKIEKVPIALFGTLAPLGLGDLESAAVRAAPLAPRSGPTSVPPPPAPSGFRTGAISRPPPAADAETLAASNSQPSSGPHSKTLSPQQAGTAQRAPVQAHDSITIVIDDVVSESDGGQSPPLPPRPPGPLSPSGKAAAHKVSPHTITKQKSGATRPGIPAPVAPGTATDVELESNIDAALAALESETASKNS